MIVAQALIIFILGSCLGSYLNVVIYRLGKNLEQEWLNEFYARSGASNDAYYQNVETSYRSTCYFCDRQLRWFELIPVLSFIFQGGKSRCCMEPLPWQYPVVEILIGLYGLFCYNLFGWSLPLFFGFSFGWVLIGIFFIDKNHQIIPDGLVYILVGLALYRALYVTHTLEPAIHGLIWGFLSLFLIQQAYLMLRAKEGLGDGDLKLMSALACWHGVGKIPELMLFSSVSGIAVIGFLSMIQKFSISSKFPFGPFLVFAWFVQEYCKHCYPL